MDWWQGIGLVLGSCVLSELIKVWLDRLKRKDTVEDRKVAESKNYTALSQKLDEFITKQESQNASIREQLSSVEGAIKLSTEVTAAGEYNAIRKEACDYIKHGSVDPVDRAELKARYERYLKLAKKSCDESLVKFLDEVDRLRSESNKGMFYED